MNIRQAPCGYKSLRHRIGHVLGANSHMQSTKCWIGLGSAFTEGLAEGLKQAERTKQSEERER